MEYTQGTIGRIFLLKFENEDILIKELSKFAKKEKLKAATMVFIGALKEGELVTGPKKPVIPPEPNKINFKPKSHECRISRALKLNLPESTRKSFNATRDKIDESVLV